MLLLGTSKKIHMAHKIKRAPMRTAAMRLDEVCSSTKQRAKTLFPGRHPEVGPCPSSRPRTIDATCLSRAGRSRTTMPQTSPMSTPRYW